MSVGSKWLLGVMLAILSVFVASTFDSWVVVGAFACLAFVVVRLRGDGDLGAGRATQDKATASRPTWMRMALTALVMLLIVAAIFAWRLGEQMGQSINPIFVGIDAAAHACVVISLLLWVFRPVRGHVSMLLMGLMVVLLCIAAGGTSQTLTAQTAVALCACIGFAFASQIILGRPVHSRGRPQNISATGQPRRIPLATLLSLFTLTLILMATSAVAKVTSDVLPAVKNRLHEQLKQTFDAVSDELLIGGTRYVQGSKLGSVRGHMLADPQGVALRIYSAKPPGYLRGTAFDIYRRRRWHRGTNRILPDWFKSPSLDDHSIEPNGKGRVELETATRRPLSRFPIGDRTNQSLVSLEILNDPLKGTTVFTPLATHWLEASSGELQVTQHNIVRVGVDVTEPYVTMVSAETPIDRVDDDRMKLLLDVPRNETTDVAGSIADRVCAGKRTAQEKADAIAEYFQSTYTYSVKLTDPPANVDPIIHFLNAKHPAHCEYFATATALMLRCAGVPTRYVTGYVAMEKSDENEYWLARNRDAHAWVEAYDEQSQRWFAVESTPGRRYITVKPLQDSSDEDDYGVDTSGANLDDDESMLGRLWVQIKSVRTTDSLNLLFRYSQLPLFCILVFLLWLRFRRNDDRDIDGNDLLSRKMLRQVDRLARRRHLIRQPQETLHQFAQRLQQHFDSSESEDKQLADISRWYIQYANARYRGELPAPFNA